MIITPFELHQKIKSSSKFAIIDIRSSIERKKFPLKGMSCKFAKANKIKQSKNQVVLICQFGIVTEQIISDKNLNNTFSLLGGVQAWNEFYKENIDLSRWSRQTVLPEIGIKGQKKLINSKIVIVGMGGLGCPAAQYLVASGVGCLKIIDGDIVELSNLHRQPIYNVNDIGKKKVVVAKEKLNQLNKNAVIETNEKYLDEKNANELLENNDVIIDATDNIKTRLVIDKFSKKLKIPMVYGGLYKFEGQVSIFNANGSKGYKEIFSKNASGGQTCEDAGVLGMLPGIIGNIQALEAIKLLVGIKPNLIGKLLIYDGLKHTTEIIEY